MNRVHGVGLDRQILKKLPAILAVALILITAGGKVALAVWLWQMHKHRRHHLLKEEI